MSEFLQNQYTIPSHLGEFQQATISKGCDLRGPTAGSVYPVRSAPARGSSSHVHPDERVRSAHRSRHPRLDTACASCPHDDAGGLLHGGAVRHRRAPAGPVRGVVCGRTGLDVPAVRPVRRHRRVPGVGAGEVPRRRSAVLHRARQRDRQGWGRGQLPPHHARFGHHRGGAYPPRPRAQRAAERRPRRCS